MSRRVAKWLKISKFIEILNRNDGMLDDFGNSEAYEHKLSVIGYAPHLGYRSWMFKYDGVNIVLHDAGNGHYSFFMPARWYDSGLMKVVDLIDGVRFKYRQLVRK